ncbi:MAG: hypothetical protein QME49_07085 [bacterium]|nr:hypothetical protein [bacterium]
MFYHVTTMGRSGNDIIWTDSWKAEMSMRKNKRVCVAAILLLGVFAVGMVVKACAERQLPEFPIYVSDEGEPVYDRCDVTGYSPTVAQCDSDPLITATNKRVRIGIVAISRDLEGDFPMNSSMSFWIDGKKYMVSVEDRMNKRHQKRVDIFFWKRSDAIKFGVKRNILIWRVE